MKFEHRLKIEANLEAVWDVLSDFPQAAQLLPGVEDVRQLDDGSYEGTLRVYVGPIRLNLAGVVQVEQDVSRGLWSMQARAQDRLVGGGVRATVEAVLTEEDSGESQLGVSADVHLMGRLGELGQPIIRRKADTMIQEFAENLKRVATERA